MRSGLTFVVAGFLGISPAAAEWQAWGYFGSTWTHDSDVDYTAGGTTDTLDVSWDGKSFEGPPYYGVRLTRWFETNPALGLQIDFNHIKTYADLDGTEAGDTFDVLEFTDGLNILTFDAVYRWQGLGAFTPYGGAGIGLNIPRVEVEIPAESIAVDEYQLGGLAAVAFVGAEYAVTGNLAFFGEYKFSYAHVEADLGGGDELSADLASHHLNFGLSYKFWH